MTPKLILVMRQQLDEWAEVDQKVMVECLDAVVQEQKVEVAKETYEAVEDSTEQKCDEEVHKEKHESVDHYVEGSTQKKSENVLAPKQKMPSKRLSKEGSSRKKKNMCYRREVELGGKEEGECDSPVDEVSKAGKVANSGLKKKRRFHSREMKMEAKEEGELDSSAEEVSNLVQPSSCQGIRIRTNRIFTLGLS